MSSKKIVVAAFIFLLFSAFVLWWVVFDLNRKAELEVVFFDVGQGDSIYLELGFSQILIDGGPGSKVLEKLGEEMPFYDRTIELLVLTHPDHDHMSGLIDVLGSYEVENILWTGVLKDTKEYSKWKEEAQKEEAELAIARRGQRMIFEENLFLEVLYPFESLEGKEVEDTNDTSIVLKATYGSDTFLFVGDITEKAEKDLLDLEIDSDILKVAHHGSRSSSCSEFLEKVSPALAVIQVGENSYGHPHPEVLARLEEFGIQVKRTDKDNDIEIISTGDNFYFKKP